MALLSELFGLSPGQNDFLEAILSSTAADPNARRKPLAVQVPAVPADIDAQSTAARMGGAQPNAPMAMAPPVEVASFLGQGQDYGPPPEAPSSATTAATAKERPAFRDQSPTFTQKLRNAFDELQGKGQDLDRAFENENLTVKALMAKDPNLTPDEALAMARNPVLMKAAAVRLFGGGGKYGKAGSVFQDGQGNFHTIQFGEDGSRKIEKLDGLTPARGYGTVDDGTNILTQNKGTGQFTGTTPKNIAERERLEQVGKARGIAEADLPRITGNAESLLSNIDKLLADPNLGSVTGWQGNLPTLRPSSHDIEARINQIKGSAFLSAFESLKGGGAITEKEGEKATQAKARLDNLKQSDEGYVQALKDFRGEVAKLVDMARRRARGELAMPSEAASGSAASPPGSRLKFNPQTGAIE